MCDRCAKFLTQAHPMISFWFYRIREVFPNVHTCRVWCGKEEQDRLVLEGASKLKWPFSQHNFEKDGVPRSRAMDLFLLNPEGEAEFPHHLYVDICGWLKSQGAPIECGVEWANFPDGDHFQLAESVEE